MKWCNSRNALLHGSLLCVFSFSVFSARIHAFPVDNEAPPTPTPHHFTSGDQVFVKPGAVVTTRNGNIDSQLLTYPIVAGAIEGDRVWVNRGWVNSSDVMSSDDALEFFNRQAMLNPSDSAPRRCRSAVWLEKENLAEALRDANDAIRLNKNDAMSFVARGLVEREQKEFEKAIEDCGIAIEIDPNIAAAFLERSTCFGLQGKFDLALEDCHQALKLDRDNPHIYEIRARVYKANNNKDMALDDYSMAIRINLSLSFLSGCGKVQHAGAVVLTTPVVSLTTTTDTRAADAPPDTVTIRLRNESRHPASIQDVFTGCHCVSEASRPAVPLRPGEECGIVLYATPPQFGDKVVPVNIKLSDNTSLNAKVELKGREWPVPRVLRSIEDLTVAGPTGQAFFRTTRIATIEASAEPPWITGFRCDDGMLTASISMPPEERPFNEHTVVREYVVDVQGFLPEKEMSNRLISVAPNFRIDPVGERSNFRVLLKTETPIRAIPTVLTVPQQSLPTRRLIWIVSDEPAEWEVSPDDEWPSHVRLLRMERIQTGQSHRFSLLLEFLPPAAGAETSTEIGLLTTLTACPKITIPIYVTGEDRVE